MKYLVVAAALLASSVAPAAAQSSEASPIQLHVRMVPGETRHYVNAVKMLLGTDGSPQAEEYTTNSTMVTEDRLDDDSILVRETFDDITFGRNDLQLDRDTALSTQATYHLHGDGTFSDFEVQGQGLAPVPQREDVFSASWPHFPPEGVLLGQKFNVTMSLPVPVPALDQARVPVEVLPSSIDDQGDRRVLNIVEASSVTDRELPLGPFGSLGTGTLSVDGGVAAQMDIDTGWLVQQKGTLTYFLKATIGQNNEQHMLVGKYEASLTLTGEDLVDE